MYFILKCGQCPLVGFRKTVPYKKIAPRGIVFLHSCTKKICSIKLNNNFQISHMDCMKKNSTISLGKITLVCDM